jgi:hypothetical protein
MNISTKGRTRNHVIAGFGLVLVASAAVRWHMQIRRPLGDNRAPHFSPVDLSQAEREAFLEGDFSIIRSVRLFPKPVLQNFVEEGGSRFTIADPGKEFNVTDAIYDSSWPNRRLLFGGVLGPKCFVLYEQGGIGLSTILVLFDLHKADTAEIVWRGYCGPAKSLDELRAQVREDREEECSMPVPREVR